MTGLDFKTVNAFRASRVNSETTISQLRALGLEVEGTSIYDTLDGNYHVADIEEDGTIMFNLAWVAGRGYYFEGGQKTLTPSEKCSNG